LEKKKQKNFCSPGAPALQTPGIQGKSFLALFFKKELLAFPSDFLRS
jgi:hypothetical protein